MLRIELNMRKHTAVSRKVVGKSARDNPERYCGWFLVHCFSNKFQRMAGEAMDVCLRGLKESNKSRFDSYSVKNNCIEAWRTLLVYTAKNLTSFGSYELIKTQIASIFGKKLKFINSFSLNIFFLAVRPK